MRSGYGNPGVTAENTYNYVNGLLAVESFDTEEEKISTMEHALAACYSYLVQKKIQWTIYLEKLAELFLDLAFQTEKHASIKEVLKHYRSITQNHHTDSLKHILEYFRDVKLQNIIDQNLPQDILEFVKNMPNIEEDQASSEIILSSFDPENKNKRQEIRQKLKIVWGGYKDIIDTVRVNQRLQIVYKTTLKKIFQFVDFYNRKQEFKTFCEYLRSGLKMALNRKDRSEQQKAFYIDIEKEEVNTNNIEIRLQQFEVTTKLGLWQEAFQVLQDINELMKVRRGSVKNSIKCSYFLKLALLFHKSCYWHYHAYAFYNYYSIYITKSKLSVDEKKKLSDRLILAVLCIPPSTLESHQSKQSQQKISSMMISSKIPEKQQMQEMMVSRGIVENASDEIKQLWYFMFLDFDLTSLDKGLRLLESLSRDGEYKQYINLLQDILIYKQLISISNVYQRMKYQNLIKLIPLPKAKIEKILLESHQRKVIDFVLDEKNQIISFEEKSDQTNPYEEFLSVYTDVALLNEETRHYEKQFIMKKVVSFTETSQKYYWEERQYKIDEYKKKLKKPKQQLMLKEREIAINKKKEKERQENERRARQIQAKEEQQKKRDLLIKKKVIVEDIKNVKQNRVVRIMNKKIQNLTDEEIQEIQISVLEKYLEQTTNKVANDNENRNKKKFSKVDYQERERRNILKDSISKCVPNAEEEEKIFQTVIENSKADYDDNQTLKKNVSAVAPQVKQKVQRYYEESYEKFTNDMVEFKKQLEEQFKKKILNKARQLYKEDKKQRDELEKRRKEADQESGNTIWSFKTISKDETGGIKTQTTDRWGRKQTTATTQTKTEQKKEVESPKKTGDSWGRKTTTSTSSNIFEQLPVTEEKPVKEESKWSLGSKKDTTQPEPVKQQPKEEVTWKKKTAIDVNEPVRTQAATKFAPPPAEKPKGAWGAAKSTFTAPKAEQKKEEPAKPKGKGKGW